MDRSMKGSLRPLAVLLLGALVALILLASTQARGLAQVADLLVGPGESIQKAVNAADPGDTIVVKGVHREDVVIRKNGISLRGLDNATIRAPARAKADSPCSRTFGPEAICVLGDVNIKNGRLTGPRVRDVSISGFTIRGFKFEGDGARVIDVTGARNATVVGNRVIGNVPGGIVVFRNVNTTVAKNHFIGSSETAADGILVEGHSRNTTVVKNVVRSYPEDTNAIEVLEGIGTTIAGNDLIGNWLGVFVEDSTGTKILSNDVSRSGILGIFLAGPKPANAKVVGNNISGSDFGMFVANAQRGSITANEVHNNCAGMVFFSDFGPPSANFEVKGNTVRDNTRKCPALEGRAAFSGLGIALFGTRGMEVRANNLSGNVPSIPNAVSGGVVVGVDPLFGGTRKPTNNTVAANDFGRNRPDIFFDGSGSGNRFINNDCNASVPARLCG